MRSPILLLGVALSAVALVAFPAQDLPILFVDDVAMIARSLTILAVAATVAAMSGTDYADSPVSSVAASHYAAQLLERDDNEVGAALRERWATFTDPATPASELVEELGLPLVVEPLADG